MQCTKAGLLLQVRMGWGLGRALARQPADLDR